MSDIEWIPGKNCDCVLKHANHPDLPLVCQRLWGDENGPRIRVHYEVYWQTETGAAPAALAMPMEIRHLWFTVLLADPMLCPDGSWYPFSVQSVRSRLNAILLEKRDIQLATATGTITGLYGKDHVVIDSIYPQGHTLEIHLSTRVLTDLPLHPLNVWLDNPAILSSAWGTAVWQ